MNYFTGSLLGDTSVDNVVGTKYVNAARFQHQVWDEYNPTFDKLTRENEDSVDNLLSSTNLQEVIIEQFSIPVTVEKLVCLRSRGLLNDEVINFYFEMLREWSALYDEACTVHYNTFFMGELQKHFQKTVLRWQKRNIHVWSVNKLLIPINISNYHWILMVVYPQRGLIEYYNSMPGTGDMYFSLLVSFLKQRAENEHQRNINWILEQGECPRQPNGFDCGVYTILNAHFLTEGRGLTMSTYTVEEATIFRKKIVYAICMGRIDFLKRYSIQESAASGHHHTKRLRTLNPTTVDSQFFGR